MPFSAEGNACVGWLVAPLELGFVSFLIAFNIWLDLPETEISRPKENPRHC